MTVSIKKNKQKKILSKVFVVADVTLIRSVVDLGFDGFSPQERIKVYVYIIYALRDFVINHQHYAFREGLTPLLRRATLRCGTC